MLQALAIRARTLVRWLVLGTIVGALCGAAAALFLWLLAEATAYRGGHPTLVYALPVAGLVIGYLYERFGTPIKAGTGLIIDTIHDGGPVLPLRMAPMVLVGTVLTHLFGGSAGREGTAVQMGASLTDWATHHGRIPPAWRTQLLVAGVAGGFGAVFGTPLAGTVFALEFVVLGRIAYEALAPALVAAVVGDFTTRALGIVHVPYPTLPSTALTPLLAAKWLLVAAAVALVATVFVELTHALRRLGAHGLPRLSLRMAVGGAIVVGIWTLLDADAYLGLSLPLLGRAFADADVPTYAFALKLLLTAITLGAGFMGGEVTPLFVVGATLGSTLAHLLGIPIGLGAGVGMAAMFAAAANTPLAMIIMAVELLGSAVLPHVAIVCVVAYGLAHHRGIYPQRT